MKPSYRPHLKLAHDHWKQIVEEGAILIDATCGNGNDSLFLAKLNPSILYCIDVQAEALAATKELLSEKITQDEMKHIKLIQGSHASFPKVIHPGTVKLIVYNLGYLPGGDKAKSTMTETTLESLGNAIQLVCNGGMISVTCYPGRPEGEKEEGQVLSFASNLDRKEWTCCHHRWINKPKSPTLLLIKKS